MTFDTDDEVRESVELVRLIARMTTYNGACDDADSEGDAEQVMNWLICKARTIFADKPQEDEGDEEAA